MFLTVLLLLEQVKTTSQKIEQILSVSTPTYRIFNAHLLARFKVLSQRSVSFAQNPENLWGFYAVIAFEKILNIFHSFS